jgi:hypothetical protein
MNGVPAIVGDNQDPERRHRVRVIIPAIDENEIYDEWASQMVFCLGTGFGSAFIPPAGSEVVLFGRLGQKYGLYYASVYNEEMTVPAGFDDEQTVGVHVPGNLKLIADLLAHLSGQNAEVIAEQLAKMTGENAHVIASSLAKLQGENAHVIASALAKLQGETAEIHGNTVTINADGSMTIHASGNIAVSAGGTLTLQSRVVNKVGPPI